MSRWRPVEAAPSSYDLVCPTTPQDCAAAFGDLLEAIGTGELTPDEGNQIGALIERRAILFHTVELQDEIAALEAQILTLAPRQQTMLRVVE